MSSGNSLRVWPAAALVLAAMLAGCADPGLYLDRRETVSFHAGDAVASNIIVQSVDPWPRVAGYRDSPANGDRMAAAGERYRTGNVIPPRGLTTSELSPESSDGGAPDAAK